MSRALAERLTLAGWLRCDSPVHVGGLGAEGDVDLALARDGLGRLFVPGSSLAGALRAALRDGSDESQRRVDDLLFGPRSPLGDAGRGSVVIIDDLLVAASGDAARQWGDDPLRPLNPPAVAVRDHVGIDRRTGAASDDLLFRRAVIPRGAWLRIRLVADLPPTEDSALHDRFLEVVATLRNGLHVGAGSTRGLGRVALVDSASYLSAASVGEGGVDALRRLLDPVSIQEPVKTVVRGVASRRHEHPTEIRVEWTPRTPVLVAAGGEGDDADAYPLAETTTEGRIQLLLPGSSVKGALRSHAERIVRTVTGIDAPGSKLLEQVDAGNVIAALFGAAPADQDSGRPDADTAEPPRPDWYGKAALSVADIRARRTIGVNAWREVTGQPQGPTDQRGRRTISDAARTELRAAGLRQRHHVAVDRWTGGAASGALFSVIQPETVAWGPLVLKVDTHRLQTTGQYDAAMALLWLIARDLQAGLIPLGSRTTRGGGSINVTAMTFTVEGQPVHEPAPAWIAAWLAYAGGVPIPGASGGDR